MKKYIICSSTSHTSGSHRFSIPNCSFVLAEDYETALKMLDVYPEDVFRALQMDADTRLEDVP